MTEGVSRAGSQVMKMGRRAASEAEVMAVGLEVVVFKGEELEEGEVELGFCTGEEKAAEGETRSIMRAILSSSSGQISGQWVKPK